MSQRCAFVFKLTKPTVGYLLWARCGTEKWGMRERQAEKDTERQTHTQKVA